MAENKNKSNIFLKTLFIIGVVVLLFILAYGLIRFIPVVFNGFASVGQIITAPFKNNDITLTVSKTQVNSQEDFIISWNDHTPNQEGGTYAIKHACFDNLDIDITDSNGTKRLLCNIPYNLNSAKSAQLTAIFNKTNAIVEVPVTISYTNPDNFIEEGEAVITVLNETTNSTNSGDANIDSQPIDSTDTNQNNSNNSTGTNTPNTGNRTFVNPTPSRADLTITNLITLANSAIRFDISNIGGQSTGAWYFEYQTPDGQTNISPIQPFLNPGQTLRFTLTFDNGVGAGNVILRVDPINVVSEINESNNVASINITGNGGNNSGPGNVNYDPNDDANFEIIDIEVGYISGNRFISDNSISDNDDAAVRFVVANTGGDRTDSWRFEIDDTPYDGNNNDYRSGTQNALNPGESVEIIVTFENPDDGTYDIEVEVDSDDDTNEQDERDNDEKERLRVRN